MLAYILALVVGLGSFGLYMAAFFFPEVHRKNDFIWSGVGLFYALVLWVCAGRITGGVLLGQMAGVALLGWLAWQTLLLRRQIAPADQQTPLPTAAELKATFSHLATPEGRSQFTQQASRTLGQLKDGVQGAIAAAKQSMPESPAKSETYMPPKLEDFGTAGQDAIERFARVAIPEETPVNEVAEVVQEAVNEAVADLADQSADAQDAVTTAANRALTQSRSTASGAPSSLPQQASNLVKVMAEMVRSLLQSFGQKNDRQPIYVRQDFREAAPETPPTQPTTVTQEVKEAASESSESKAPYVRKKFREATSEAPETKTPYVRKKFREAASEPAESKAPYVRKKFREAASESSESKTPYVRKKFRPDNPDNEEPQKPQSALSDVTDATIISVTEEINRASDGSLVAEAVIEIESETLAPDLLASAMVVTSTSDPNATVEDIVEELLEDISVQEEVFSGVVEAEGIDDSSAAVPPHPPSPELVEAAITDAEEKGLPYDPPEVKEL